MYKYFTNTDFKNASPPCNINDVDSHFLSRLDTAREIANIPFKITSAYRTTAHELKQGRDGTSSHTKGLAVDIKVETPLDRLIVIESLLRVNIKRIIIYPTWIHCDIDPTKPKLILYKHE